MNLSNEPWLRHTQSIHSPDQVAAAVATQWMADSNLRHASWLCTPPAASADEVLEELVRRGLGPIRVVQTNPYHYFLISDAFMLTVVVANGFIELNTRCAHAQVVAACTSVLPPMAPTNSVRWWYLTERGIVNQMMTLEGDDPRPEFYPWIDDLDRFFEGFGKSDASVLVLIGPPGTGKTTFIRGLLRQLGMQAWITYDERVQASDDLYVRFASIDDGSDGGQFGGTVRPGRVMVLEDADAMLESRQDGNKIMARLLNLSNGLIKLPQRKLVFSTNLPSLTSVDPALLRPGRCYGVVQFRKLNVFEACAARQAVGLPVRVFKEPVTLAEALCDEHNIGTQPVVRAVGF